MGTVMGMMSNSAEIAEPHNTPKTLKRPAKQGVSMERTTRAEPATLTLAKT